MTTPPTWKWREGKAQSLKGLSETVSPILLPSLLLFNVLQLPQINPLNIFLVGIWRKVGLSKHKLCCTTHKKTNLHLNSSDGLIWQPSWWVWNIINSMRAKSVDGGNIYYPWIRDPGALLTYFFWSGDVSHFANVYQDMLFPFPGVYVNSLLMSIQPWW